MAPKLQYFDARTASVAEVVKAIEDDGAAVVTNLIAPEVADRIVAEMTPFMEKSGLGRDNFAGTNTVRTGALVARSKTFRENVMLNPFLIGASEKVLLPWCERFQFMVAQVIKIGPGSPGQPLHRDRAAWGRNYLGEDVEPQMATIWALSDFTRENGATRIVPKTHTRPINYDYEPSEDEICYAEMPKGSAVFYTGSAMHSGGENSTKDQWRVGMHVSYALGWLRQEENQYLSCPPHIARTFAPEIQELLGYSLSGYALGYASAPTLEEVPSRDLVKDHAAAPLGSDIVAPEVLLGRAPRPWNESAGTHKDGQDIISGNTLGVKTVMDNGEGAEQVAARL
ncbi:hypothetical protein DFJ74DRAFT_763202 [Hyaloraphidium curvatum]|nr:hypothetical protein DFJ74DRAFT_763202 [Hyaloraphidium curvatum]